MISWEGEGEVERRFGKNGNTGVYICSWLVERRGSVYRTEKRQGKHKWTGKKSDNSSIVT